MSFNLSAILVLAVTVTILIVAEIRKTRRLIYIFKPLSTLIVIAVALAGILASGGFVPFRSLVLAGLLLSLGGDILLMPPDTQGRFRAGLVLFLAAHVAYVAAFWRLGGWREPDFVIGAVLLLVVLGYYRLLWPKLGKMKVPVAVYMVVISLMLSRALSTLFVAGMDPARGRLIAAGAALFFVSDIILSANRFWKPWYYERISLAFYFGGQLCIALSAGI